MKDIVVIQSLRNRGVGLNDVNEVILYESIERKPRFLDKAPKRLNLTKMAPSETYGCCAEFIMCFNDKKSNLSVEQATLDLRGCKRYCDADVYVTLLTLIDQGFTCTEERASACFDVFRVIMTAPGETLTVRGVYDALNSYEPCNYYAEELVKAISVCLFNEKAPVLHWLNLCEFSGFYKNAIELGKEVIRKECETEKDVEKLLRPLYKEAKEDKEFIGNIYKPGANKWLIPMIYKLHKTNPEVLEPSGGGGFA